MARASRPRCASWVRSRARTLQTASTEARRLPARGSGKHEAAAPRGAAAFSWFFAQSGGMFALVFFWLRRPDADAGGMPSRNLRCPAPTSGRRPSMAGSGHPPCARTGHHLSRGLERRWTLTARFLPDPGSLLTVAAAAAIAVALALGVRFAAGAAVVFVALDLSRGRISSQPVARTGGVRTAGQGWPAAGSGSRTRRCRGSTPPVCATGRVHHHGADLHHDPAPQASLIRSRSRSSITTASSTASLFPSLGRRIFFRS